MHNSLPVRNNFLILQIKIGFVYRRKKILDTPGKQKCTDINRENELDKFFKIILQKWSLLLE